MAQYKEVLSQLREISGRLGVLEYLKDRIDGVSTSIEFINAKFEEHKNELTGVKVECERLRSENKELKEMVADLKNQANGAKSRIEESEQYSRRNNIEVIGIPETPNEDPNLIVKKIGEVIGIPIEERDLDDCHRVPTQRQGPKPLIIRFVSRKLRNKVITKSKEKRLKSKDLVPGPGNADRPIFFNDHLIMERKKVLSEVKARQAELRIKFVWTHHGTIFARKAEGSQAYKIHDAVDIEKVR